MSDLLGWMFVGVLGLAVVWMAWMPGTKGED